MCPSAPSDHGWANLPFWVLSCEKKGGGLYCNQQYYPWNPLSTLILMVLTFPSPTSDFWNVYRLGDQCLPSISFSFSHRKMFVPYSGGISINLTRKGYLFISTFFFYNLCISKNCYSVFEAFQKHVSITFKFLLFFPLRTPAQHKSSPIFCQDLDRSFCLVYLSFVPSFLILYIMNLI